MSPFQGAIQGSFPGGVAYRRPVRPGSLQAFGAGHAAQLPESFTLPRVGGQALPEPVREKMEAYFQADFSDVRVHQGHHASTIGALAFTLGSEIHFAPGQYDPHSPRGQQLLGHELTHVMQQRKGRVRNPFGSGLAVVQDPALEAEAERMGVLAARATVQAKLAAPRQDGFRVAQSRVGGGRRSFTLYQGGQPVGGGDLHLGGQDAKVYNLKVDSRHRGRGGGRELLRAMAQEGMREGRSVLRLTSEDRGSGHLTRWYEGMGFRRVGVGEHGMTALEIAARQLR